MSLASEMLHYRRLAAPRQDRSVLVQPPFGELGSLLAGNIARGKSSAIDLQGRTLADLASAARKLLLSDAQDYTRQYLDPAPLPADAASAPFILAGHQPQLFHPGVWCKNFALSLLAQRHQAVAINLLVDSDAVKKTSSRVPSGNIVQPALLDVPFDVMPEANTPYEERKILDWPTFETFGSRAAAEIAPLIPDTLLNSYWPRAIARGRATGNLGLALAQSRHQIEREWGMNTLELPQSHCCQGVPYYHFVAHLLANLPRLWDVYNASVREFRHVNRIRSAAHPVPDLAIEGDWLEAPFWVWSGANPRRRRLFVRAAGEGLELTDRHGWSAALSAHADGELAVAVEQLDLLARGGLRLRTRALLTTMYARLLLSDLFIHGIGGSKYDELTDQLIHRFFDLEPAGYATISATLKLPLPLPTVEAESLSQLDHEIRELDYHPETYLPFDENGRGSADAGASSLVEQKRRWITTPPGPDNVRQRYLEIRRLNAALRPWVAPVAEELTRRRTQLGSAARVAAILGSREYDFCLFPTSLLRDFLCRDMPAQLDA
ncbi:MAG: hypothetical protein K8T25_13545 [Planctomycetia bacterium]|nr:hypothetical protein [Planctomycetia bacterium]